jgi:transposase-like protein
VAIVWSCALSVDEYVASGREVVIPRPDCPACAAPMSFWSGYERSVRCSGPCLKVWVRRARCGPCRASHVLVPSFCLVGRLDAVEVIGGVVAAVVGDGEGVRPVAARIDVPHSTARDWVRRFGRRAAMLAAGFAALVVELSGWAPRLRGEPTRQALRAICLSFAAARARAGPMLPGLWCFAALVTGGTLLAANSDPLSIVVGKRRFIPPVP